MKCKTKKCKNDILERVSIEFCGDCLREKAQNEMRKYPELFSKSFPELFNNN